jgi:GTP cyclohydrolase IA
MPVQNISDAENRQVSGRISSRLRCAGVAYGPNDNIADYMHPFEVDGIEAEVSRRVADLLDALVIDRDAPHSSETAARVARMLVRETFAGRFEPRPPMTQFPNDKADEVYVVGPVTLRSCCAHHMIPIQGRCWVGVIPNGSVLGLSKFSRLVAWIAARGQVQEELTVQIADELETILTPRGLAVVIKAAHLCCQWRGVRDGAQMMTTSVTRGLFREDARARAELMTLIGAP